MEKRKSHVVILLCSDLYYGVEGVGVGVGVLGYMGTYPDMRSSTESQHDGQIVRDEILSSSKYMGNSVDLLMSLRLAAIR